METILIDVLTIIWGILSIILFFKVWGMCDDVRALRNKFAPKQKDLFETDKDIDKWLAEDPNENKKHKKS